MMGNLNVRDMGWFGGTGILFYILFWIGIASLAYYVITLAKENKERIFLVVGVVLVLGTIFVTTLFGGMMMRNLWGKGGMMGGAMKEFLKDDEFRNDMREMMDDVEKESQ